MRSISCMRSRLRGREQDPIKSINNQSSRNLESTTLSSFFVSSLCYNESIMTSSLRHLSSQFQRCVRLRPYATFTTELRSRSILSTHQAHFFSSDTSENDKKEKIQSSLTETNASDQYDVQEIMESFRDTSYYDPVEKPDYSHLTNEELRVEVL